MYKYKMFRRKTLLAANICRLKFWSFEFDKKYIFRQMIYCDTSLIQLPKTVYGNNPSSHKQQQ